MFPPLKRHLLLELILTYPYWSSSYRRSVEEEKKEDDADHDESGDFICEFTDEISEEQLIEIFRKIP